MMIKLKNSFLQKQLDVMDKKFKKIQIFHGLYGYQITNRSTCMADISISLTLANLACMVRTVDDVIFSGDSIDISFN